MQILEIPILHVDSHPEIPFKARIFLISEILELTLNNLNCPQVFTPFSDSVVSLPHERRQLPAHYTETQLLLTTNGIGLVIGCCLHVFSYFVKFCCPNIVEVIFIILYLRHYFPCFVWALLLICYNVAAIKHNYKQIEEEKANWTHGLHSREEKAWIWIMQLKLKKLCLLACSAWFVMYHWLLMTQLPVGLALLPQLTI